MTCVDTDKFRFLDICNFIAPGFTYDKYLRAYGCEQTKGFFPYEWFDCLQKLDANFLPPASAFNSSLRDSKITASDYEYCLDVWERLGMKTFREFLIWYNNLGVQPFLEAIAKQSAVYREKGIDMLKSAISLPGLSVRWLFADEVGKEVQACHRKHPTVGAGLFRAFRDDARVRLIDTHNSDLYTLIKNGIVGGPSIVFSRHHEKDKTLLRPSVYQNPKTCKEILGVDANALYLWCMMQDMPVGGPKRWQRIEPSSNIFQPMPSHKSKSAHGWLAWMSYINNTYIQHEHNSREVVLSDRCLPVDGFCVELQTAYQFHGCYWHGHQCQRNAGIDIHPTKKVSMKSLETQTRAREDYLRALGYTVVSVWECEWERTVSATEKIRSFLKTFFASMYPSRWKELSEERLISRIASGAFYGLVECDVHVPPHLEGKFSEMAPIFKNALVGREHLSPIMLEHAESHDYLRRPQRMLIGSLKGERILLYSELLKWYLQHGLVVSRVHQLVEYVPRKIFERFGLSVTEARRLGDVDTSKKLLADTHKLVGNSTYGKTITNKDKHRDVRYIEGHKNVSARIRSQRFCSAEEISEGLYETVSLKQKVGQYSKVSF